MDACRICQSTLGAPVYESLQPISITSLCQVLDGRTRVWHCADCGHTQTEPLPSLDRFYAEDYHILTASEQDDQLYAVRAGRKIFRTEHQLATLLAKLQPSADARVLDYGCGKAATLKALFDVRPDIQPFVYDVGEQYRPFWDAFVPAAQQAVDATPAEWSQSFDLATSFYALEHVADPRGMLANIHGLLREGGAFYFLVPNVFANVADLVVADHVNHFSARSLRRLLTTAGFIVENIDATSHDSAWVVVARKGKPQESESEEAMLGSEIAKIAEYWQGFGADARQFEADHPGPAAIYGSGFYGTFIHTCLAEAGRIECFLDQNPHRQKQRLLNLPILPPESLPDRIENLYIGLNPRIARREIDGLECLRAKPRSLFVP
jgi:SAM-dependent methyltransferase